MSYIRIEETGDLAGPHTRVFYIANDGTETDISNVVTAVTYTGKVGEANRATVELIKVHARITSPLTDAVVHELKPARRRLRRRLLDITHVGAKARSYISP